jgi:beta-lactamase class A
VAFFARGGTNRPRAIAEAARAIYDGFVTMVRRPFMAVPLGAN